MRDHANMAAARPEPVGGAPAWAARSPRSSWLIQFIRRRPMGAVSALVILLMVLAALLADVIAPYDPLETSFLLMLRPPSPDHLMGTDAFGRDVWSRILYASRTALVVGF